MDEAWVAIIISVGAALISLSTAVSAFWGRQRKFVLELWSALVSGEVGRARSLVARAALAEELDEEEQRDFIEAAFRLLWELQRVAVAVQTIRKTAIAPTEAKWLYRQIESVLPDLQTAILRHGADVDWEPTLTHTNDVLNSLPLKVKDSWGRTVSYKNFDEIEGPKSPKPIPSPADPDDDSGAQ